MKDTVIQLLLSIIITFIGVNFGVAFALEEPHYVGKNYVLLFVGIFNALWLVPYCIYYLKRKRKMSLWFAIAIYLIFIVPFIAIRVYKKPFNSEKWKSEINNYMYYDNNPAHANGNMVPDIIDSKILIGLSTNEIEELLGKNYFIYDVDDVYVHDTVFQYFYSNRPLFDGCDKLSVTIKNGRCVEADFGGCD
ncbi:MAG: hypothetical protein LBR55_05420 [Bacteroidales bacterium]|jgi:hypothetical protein|nr:hypothetical protein [Bacteroidales bacterium]